MEYLKDIYNGTKTTMQEDWDKETGGASVSWHSHMLPLEKAYEMETGHGVEYSNPDNTRNFSSG